MSKLLDTPMGKFAIFLGKGIQHHVYEKWGFYQMGKIEG